MSCIVKKKVGNGQTMVTCHGRDDSNHSVPNGMGGKMGGSTSNLAHSIVGSSAKEGGNASKEKKDRFD